MKAFLLKFKSTLFFWLIFLAIVLYFAPKQSSYYLDNDIRYFRRHYLTPLLMWTGVAISVALLLVLLIKTISIKRSSLPFIYGAVTIAFFLFIFQDLFLAASLFINRQFKQNSVPKTYLANYVAGTEPTKENFIP